MLCEQEGSNSREKNLVNAHPTALAARFSDAAQRYEQAAIIQKQAAIQFDLWLAQQGLAPPRAIAEIGCGTGFLTRLLHARYPYAIIEASDLAPAMVDFCRKSGLFMANVHFTVRDGRDAVFELASDWIVSAMCFQWFDPLQPVLAHHLASSRVLAFSILLGDSFSAWRSAHACLGLSPGLHACPDYQHVLQSCHQLGAARIQAQRISLSAYHVNGLSFVHSLRAIGADQPKAGHRPVNLKPVLKQLEKGFCANYEIGFFCIERE